MKIALVHDDFVQAGGAESLFATIASLYPQAPIYTSLVDWNKLPKSIDRTRLKYSLIQKIPFARKFYKALLPLYPLAFESFDFTPYDLVISSTTRFAKAPVTKPQTVHICYINNVPRFLWDQKIMSSYLSLPLKILLKPLFAWLKKWDKVAASRPDYYIANSKNVAARVKKYYGQDAAVVYPFCDLDFFKPAKIHNWQLKGQNYFLVVSRLVRWKKIDIAIEAAKIPGINLKIVGTGPDEGRLKKLAFSVQRPASSNQIEFLGRVDQNKLRQLYQNCQALIVTQEEDFGIASIEAQACGRPVIAYRLGGQQEITKDKKTGLFFKNQTLDSLKDAISRFSEVKWKESACRKNSQRFSQAVFTGQLKDKIKLYASKS